MLEPIRSCVDEALLALTREYLGEQREIVRALRPVDFEASTLRLRAVRNFDNPTFLDRVRSRLEKLLTEKLGTNVEVRVLFKSKAARASALPVLEHATNKPLIRLFERIARGDVGRHRLIYVYGSAGVGKTFVVERALLEAMPSPAARFDGSEFHTEYLARQRARSLTAWRNELVATPLFVLDEVHRLGGKMRTQAELCSILDGLRTRKALAILVARHHPRGIHRLSSALETRMLAGFTHEIHLPPREVREAFVDVLGVDGRDRARVADLTLTPRSFGEIERRAAAGAGTAAGDPDLASSGVRDDFLERIVNRVADAFACDVDALRGPQSTRRHSLPRHVVVFVARRAGISGAEMARRFGWNSPSSASYAVRHVEERMRDDPDFRRVVQSII
ncbi:MAG: AAA family ATPase [Planctomycetes bacterium]|nr:AAA family ATPase [Planctomycetota bacterium]MCB9918119.1 AAA family ATPase [Planctomycetota bacterium]